MNINNFKNKINPVIFERGENYYFDNAVVDLQGTENGQWFALVEGSYADDYEVDIKINSDGEIQKYYCNCPYDGAICKHVVAVLLKIKDEKQITGTEVKNKKEAWKEIADNVPENELREFIKKYAAKNSDFRNDLTVRFSEYSNSDTGDIYRHTVQNIFFSAGGKYGFIDYNHIYTAMRQIDSLLYNAEDLIKEKKHKEAFRIVSAIAPECINNIENIDDSNGECGGAIYRSFELVSKILKLSDDETFKNEVFEWIFEQAQNKNYNDYGCGDELEPLLIEACDNRHKINIVHEFIDKKLKQTESRDDWSGNYQKTKYLKHKVKLYNISDETKKADKIIYDNINLTDFRKIIVDRKINDKNYKEAVNLIEEGIKIATKDNLSGITIQWKETLLKIYQELKDIKNIKKYAEELFFSGWNDMSYYKILKEIWKPEDKEIEKLLKKNPKQGNYYYSLPVSVANIYIEEKMWDRLFELVKQNPRINTLLTYTQYLKELYPSELIKLFKTAIEKFADKNTGRSAYKDIVDYLYKMSEIKDAKDEAKNIMHGLLDKYKNRPAMKDEFMKSSFYKK
ncbi:MAG: hypothetical protein GXO80_00925 [Chlorobi bacterium]|nr:hypothetical protein [Chlorobiota bacterium]